jgi:hypothetical protein
MQNSRYSLASLCTYVLGEGSGEEVGGWRRLRRCRSVGLGGVREEEDEEGEEPRQEIHKICIHTSDFRTGRASRNSLPCQRGSRCNAEYFISSRIHLALRSCKIHEFYVPRALPSRFPAGASRVPRFDSATPCTDFRRGKKAGYLRLALRTSGPPCLPLCQRNAAVLQLASSFFRY